MTPWIDVAERLPEVGKRVLVYAPDTQDKYYAAWRAASYPVWHTHGGHTFAPLSAVTAWREIEPVPEPPKAPTGEELVRAMELSIGTVSGGVHRAFTQAGIVIIDGKRWRVTVLLDYP